MFLVPNDPHPYCMNACEAATMCGEVQVPEHHLEVCVIIIRSNYTTTLPKNVFCFYSRAGYAMPKASSAALWEKEPE